MREVHFCAPAASWLNVKSAFLSDYNHFLFNNARCGAFLLIFLENLFRHLKLHLLLSFPPHCKSGRAQVKLCPTPQLHQTLYFQTLCQISSANWIWSLYFPNWTFEDKSSVNDLFFNIEVSVVLNLEHIC